MGRIPTFQGAPRVIDLDVLLYGNRIVDDLDLTIPHPRMAQRRFVLEPLSEIAPDAIHPVLGKSFRSMLLVVRIRPRVRPHPARVLHLMSLHLCGQQAGREFLLKGGEIPL